MESLSQGEVSSDDEFVVPPLKRTKTTISGGNQFIATIRMCNHRYNLWCNMHLLLQLFAPLQSTLSVDTALIWIL